MLGNEFPQQIGAEDIWSERRCKQQMGKKHIYILHETPDGWCCEIHKCAIHERSPFSSMSVRANEESRKKAILSISPFAICGISGIQNMEFWMHGHSHTKNELPLLLLSCKIWCETNLFVENAYPASRSASPICVVAREAHTAMAIDSAHIARPAPLRITIIFGPINITDVNNPLWDIVVMQEAFRVVYSETHQTHTRIRWSDRVIWWHPHTHTI